MTRFVAIWYNPKKVEAKAKERGWPGGDALLDYYNPDEDPSGHEAIKCRDLQSAITHLRNIIAEGQDFWGQGVIREFESVVHRCHHCVCAGQWLRREYTVDETGIIETVSHASLCEE